MLWLLAVPVAALHCGGAWVYAGASRAVVPVLRARAPSARFAFDSVRTEPVLPRGGVGNYSVCFERLSPGETVRVRVTEHGSGRVIGDVSAKTNSESLRLTLPVAAAAAADAIVEATCIAPASDACSGFGSGFGGGFGGSSGSKRRRRAGGTGGASTAHTDVLKMRVISAEKLRLIMALQRRLLFSRVHEAESAAQSGHVPAQTGLNSLTHTLPSSCSHSRETAARETRAESGAESDGASDRLPRVSSLVASALLHQLFPAESEGSSLDSAGDSFALLLRRLRLAFEPEAAPSPWLDEEWLERSGFACWVSALESATPQLAAELEAALASEGAPSNAPPLNAPLASSSPTWERADYEAIAPDWRVRHLWQGGEWLPAAESDFPQTLGALRAAEERSGLRLNPMQNVACGIARLPPGAEISPHCDGNLLGVTCHLGLRIPKGAWIEVGGERREWSEGRLSVFDTTFTHAVGNPSESEDRYVLMLNVLRPGVSQLEVEAMRHYLASPSPRLGALNLFYLWVPAAEDVTTKHASEGAAQEADQEAVVPLMGEHVTPPHAGELFLSLDAPAERHGRPHVHVSPGRWLPLRTGESRVAEGDLRESGLALIVPYCIRFAVKAPLEWRALPSEAGDAIGDAIGGEIGGEIGDEIVSAVTAVDAAGAVEWVGIWAAELSPLEQRSRESLIGCGGTGAAELEETPLETLRAHIRLLDELPEAFKWVHVSSLEMLDEE